MADQKWVLIGLQVGFALVALTASKALNAKDCQKITVWLGQEVHLPCGDNSSGSIIRFWRFGDEDLINKADIIESKRFSLNQLSILRIVNVTMDDDGYYKCIAFTQPLHTRTLHLQVKEKRCVVPIKPLNGDYDSDTKMNLYDAGDTIRYYCHAGYEFVGEAIRTCRGTLDGWTPETPHCQRSAESKDVLMRRLTDLELKVSNVEINLSKFESRLSSLESNMSSPRSSNDFKPTRKERSIANDYEPDRVSQCMAMQLGVRDGHDVSQFKFVVKNFRNKALTGGVTVVDSQPFYHKVPGYKFMLRMTIRYDYSIFVHLVHLPGDYDNQLTWPVIPRFTLAVLMNDGREMNMSTDAGPSCKVDRTQAEKIVWCNERNPMADAMFRQLHHILHDGSVVVTIYVNN